MPLLIAVTIFILGYVLGRLKSNRMAREKAWAEGFEEGRTMGTEDQREMINGLAQTVHCMATELNRLKKRTAMQIVKSVDPVEERRN
jgi:flagellar biosynthesis/type III secretory pathway protein FliH